MIRYMKNKESKRIKHRRTRCKKKKGSPARYRTLVSWIQGRRDNCFAIGEPTLEPYVISVLSIIRAVLTKPIAPVNSVAVFCGFSTRYCGYCRFVFAILQVLCTHKVMPTLFPSDQ